MGRWSQYDSDEERLPSGMKRIGYDADTQTYSYRDTDGSIWEGPPGSQYGQLTRVSGPPPPSTLDANDHHLEALEPMAFSDDAGSKPSWRQEMMPLLNFLVLVGLFLLFVFWFIGGRSSGTESTVCRDGSSRYDIQPGDTCWGIAEVIHTSVDHLLQENPALDCDALPVGKAICIPAV
ncbi:hypothetical protein DL771_002370 [Monosporascus sp. 5C6A]|nr:hypothetical protein DL771_002370 [Monosporascus sp. 5C6A]